MQSNNMLDSRQALAAEIAESVQLALHAKQSAEQLNVTIEKSLLDEARRAELKLAYLRVAAAGVFAFHHRPAAAQQVHFSGIPDDR